MAANKWRGQSPILSCKQAVLCQQCGKAGRERRSLGIAVKAVTSAFSMGMNL
jgi:hypothetical protein